MQKNPSIRVYEPWQQIWIPIYIFLEKSHAWCCLNATRRYILMLPFMPFIKYEGQGQKYALTRLKHTDILFGVQECRDQKRKLCTHQENVERKWEKCWTKNQNTYRLRIKAKCKKVEMYNFPKKSTQVNIFNGLILWELGIDSEEKY